MHHTDEGGKNSPQAEGFQSLRPEKIRVGLETGHTPFFGPKRFTVQLLFQTCVGNLDWITNTSEGNYTQCFGHLYWLFVCLYTQKMRGWSLNPIYPTLNNCTAFIIFSNKNDCWQRKRIVCMQKDITNMTLSPLKMFLVAWYIFTANLAFLECLRKLRITKNVDHKDFFGLIYCIPHTTRPVCANFQHPLFMQSY